MVLDCFGVLMARVLGKATYEGRGEGNIWSGLYHGEHYGPRHSLVSLLLWVVRLLLPRVGESGTDSFIGVLTGLALSRWNLSNTFSM